MCVSLSNFNILSSSFFANIPILIVLTDSTIKMWDHFWKLWNFEIFKWPKNLNPALFLRITTQWINEEWHAKHTKKNLVRGKPNYPFFLTPLLVLTLKLRYDLTWRLEKNSHISVLPLRLRTKRLCFVMKTFNPYPDVFTLRLTEIKSVSNPKIWSRYTLIYNVCSIMIVHKTLFFRTVGMLEPGSGDTYLLWFFCSVIFNL